MKRKLKLFVRGIGFAALLATEVCFAAPGDGDETSTAERAPVEQPQGSQNQLIDPETSSVDSIIRSLRESSPRGPEAASLASSPSALASLKEPHHLAQLQEAVRSPENVRPLRDYLGKIGYQALVELADKVSKAAGTNNPWTEMEKALQEFRPEDFESNQAKAVVIGWLRKEATGATTVEVNAPLIILSQGSVLVPLELAPVLERIERALSAVKLTEPTTLLSPVAQLMALSPYIAGFSQSKEDRITGHAFRVAKANTDLSELELMELFLRVAFDVHAERRLYSVFGTQHSFRVILRQLRRVIAENQLVVHNAGGLLMSLQKTLEFLDVQRSKAIENKWTATLDLSERLRWDLRQFVRDLLLGHPELIERLGEFGVIRDHMAYSESDQSCRASIAGVKPLPRNPS